MQQLHKGPWSQVQVQCLGVRTGYFCIQCTSHGVSAEALPDEGVKRGLCHRPAKKTVSTACQTSNNILLLSLSCLFYCFLCLADSTSIGLDRLATIWNFRGQTFKAGTSILSICNFDPRLLFTLLHSIWRPVSEEAGTQFSLCIVLGCGWRKDPASAVCFCAFC